MTDTTPAVLTAEKYVVITTRKKNGDEVATPVWIAPLADGSFGFTTDLTSGKVKRIRNFPDVTLQPSTMRGAIKPGTTVIRGRATVLVGDDAAPVEAAIRQKYGFVVTLIGLGERIKRVVKRSKTSERAAVRIELADDTTAR